MAEWTSVASKNVKTAARAVMALVVIAVAHQQVVVMDHHLMHDDHTPPTLALVNPNRPDDTSGHGFLAAAGVVFVLVAALNRLARKRGVAAVDIAPISRKRGATLVADDGLHPSAALYTEWTALALPVARMRLASETAP